MSTKENKSKDSKTAYGAAGRTNLLTFDPSELTLVTDEKHPLYDERVHLPVNEKLVLNIMHHGVIEPIVIYKDPETGKVLVAVGRQRTKATIEANKRLKAKGEELIMIPATVRRGDGVSLSGIMISENELREGDSPMTRAKKMARQMEMGRTEDDLAILFGCEKATVKNTLALLDCSAVVRNAVDEGKINVTAAYKLAKLPADEQKITVEKMVKAGAGAKGHQKSRAQKEAAGTERAPSKKEITELREDIAQRCADEDFRKVALPMLDYVLGKRKTAPRFDKEDAAE